MFSRYFFLFFGLWTLELLNFDLRIGFLVNNCIFGQLETSRIQQVDPKMIGADEPEHDHSDDDAAGSMDMARMRDIVKNPEDEKQEETFANSPGDREKDDPKTMDTDTLVNVHSGGLNARKQQYQ